ncbi:hypothetical protein BT69DRAFT_543124 [Atractiella rhizophila]|nr:hypothetical protein BT69DRAFT_543124 [Atractiella rhizophila]
MEGGFTLPSVGEAVWSLSRTFLACLWLSHHLVVQAHTAQRWSLGTERMKRRRRRAGVSIRPILVTPRTDAPSHHHHRHPGRQY